MKLETIELRNELEAVREQMRLLQLTKDQE